MKKIPILCFIIFAACALWPSTPAAAPNCYTQAALPAHKWAVEGDVKSAGTVTALAADGESCVPIPLWRGMPILRAEMYVPFMTLYESYATALDAKNSIAAQHVYTWLRPTPRPFPLWLDLFYQKEGEDPPGPPSPWGLTGMIKVIKYLHSDVERRKSLPTDPEELPRPHIMRDVWPMLFIDMGGIVLPSPKKTALSVAPRVEEFWMHVFPGIAVERSSYREGNANTLGINAKSYGTILYMP